MSVKKYIFTGSLLILFVFIYLSKGYEIKHNIFFSTPVSAGQPDNNEELIKYLEDAKNREDRKKLYETYKQNLTPSFIISLLDRARHSVDMKTFSLEKSSRLADIAVEAAEFTGDKITMAKAIMYRADFKKNDEEFFSEVDKALSLFRERDEKKGEALCYYKKAKRLCFFAGKKEEASLLFDKALKLLVETGDGVYLADCYLAGALCHNNKETIKNMEEALSLYKAEGDIPSEMFCCQSMAVFCQREGLTDEALKYYEKKDDLLKSLDFDHMKDFFGKESGYFRNNHFESKETLLFSHYDTLGDFYVITCRYEDAIRSYKKAIEAVKKSDAITSGEILCYWKTGNNYKILGQKDMALKYYMEAINKNPAGMNMDALILNYINLGDFYLNDLNRPDDALKCYMIAREKCSDFNMPFSGDMARIRAITGIAMAYEKKGDFDKAVEMIEFSHKENLKIKGTTDLMFYDEFYYTFLLRICEKKGDKEKNLFYLNKMLESAEKSNDKWNLSLAYGQAGHIYYRTKDYTEALDYYSKAIAIAESTGSPVMSYPFYMKAGEIYEIKGNNEEARKCYIKSIDIIEHMRRDIKVEDFKRDFMKDKIDTYERLIDLLIRMKREEEAFEYNEKARSRAFLDILASEKVKFHQGIRPDLADKEKDVLAKIQSLSGDISKERTSPNRRTAFIDEQNMKLKKLKKEYEELLGEMKLQNPEYADLISVNPFSLKEIKMFLPDDTLLVEYFLGKERSYIWIAGKNTFKTVTINRNKDEIEKPVRELRSYICDNMTGEKLKSDKWIEPSKELYTLIFGDAEKYIHRKKLVISPHRSLHYIPFQVLADREGKVLLEKYDISYIPSASVLKYCEDKNTEKKNSLLAFSAGNAGFEGFSPIPGTEKEVKAIEQFFTSKEIYSGKDMKTDILYRKGSSFDIIHIATHGVLDSSNPLFSCLMFSDRRLNVYDIFNLELRSSLVCLSACKSGLSEDCNGDELVGLSRAFIYAGTPCVCSSLWDVSDASTKELMERFYYHLQNTGKSEALRLAGLEIREKYSHPFFWSPFILTGAGK